jgi:hypothetical protein
MPVRVDASMVALGKLLSENEAYAGNRVGVWRWIGLVVV